MPKNNSKTRELSKKELNEVFDVTCEKYLNKTVKINNLHALSKYLYWINNYYHEMIYKTWDGDTTKPEVKVLIDHLTRYSRYLITLGYKKYFSKFSIQAYHWSDKIGNGRNYQKGDFSGMVIRLYASDNKDNYFELSVATPYLKDSDRRNQYHKMAQYVTHYNKTNSITDLNRIDKSAEDLAYIFLPVEICALVEESILKILEESDDLKCWVILQTGYTF